MPDMEAILQQNQSIPGGADIEEKLAVDVMSAVGCWLSADPATAGNHGLTRVANLFADALLEQERRNFQFHLVRNVEKIRLHLNEAAATNPQVTNSLVKWICASRNVAGAEPMAEIWSNTLSNILDGAYGGSAFVDTISALSPEEAATLVRIAAITAQPFHARSDTSRFPTGTMGVNDFQTDFITRLLSSKGLIERPGLIGTYWVTASYACVSFIFFGIAYRSASSSNLPIVDLTSLLTYYAPLLAAVFFLVGTVASFAVLYRPHFRLTRLAKRILPLSSLRRIGALEPLRTFVARRS